MQASIKSKIALLRPHHWLKNLFIFAPLFFTPRLMNLSDLLLTLLGFISFSCVASGIYVLNDLLDRKADRLHPDNSSRPLAASLVSVQSAITMIIILLSLGLLLAVFLDRHFSEIVLTYLLLNIFYCLYLKHISIIDILTISLSFILRVFAGAMLINITPTVWILVCTGLLALFLATAKRRNDLVQQLDEEHRQSLGGYTLQFLDVLLIVVISILLGAYTIYTTDPLVMRHLGNDHIYLTAPLVFAGIMRYCQIIYVEQQTLSPTLVCITDRFIRTVVFAWIVSFILLLYT